MEQRFEFEGEFYKGQQGGLFIDFPFNARTVFGKTGVIRVRVWLDGSLFRLGLLPRKDGPHYLHIRREIRDALGKKEGDSLKIVIEADKEAPQVEIPDYLQWLLEDDPALNAVFMKLSYSMKKQLVGYVEQPKTDEARVHRVNHFFKFLMNRNLKSGNLLFNPEDET